MYTTRPKWNAEGKFWNARWKMDSCHNGFRRVTGITLKPGECKRVKLVVVED